jgi:hypothetical protein
VEVEVGAIGIGCASEVWRGEGEADEPFVDHVRSRMKEMTRPEADECSSTSYRWMCEREKGG